MFLRYDGRQVENRHFRPTTPLFDALVGVMPLEYIAIKFAAGELESLRYRSVRTD